MNEHTKSNPDADYEDSRNLLLVSQLVIFCESPRSVNLGSYDQGRPASSIKNLNILYKLRDIAKLCPV